MSPIRRTLTVIGLTAAAVAAGSGVRPSPAQTSVTINPVADTTATEISQDGDNGPKTTLASCPQLCDGNPDARRQAILEFAVRHPPPHAVAVRARLRVYTWESRSARVVAHVATGGARAAGTAGSPVLGAALDVRHAVQRGYNEWDVSAAVRHNGTYTFALRQETAPSRVYWASREHHDPALRPELVLSYRGSARLPDLPDRPGSATAGPPPPAGPPPAGPQPEPSGWRRVWSDEFNDTTVDRSAWNIRNNEARDVDRGCNTDRAQNVFEGNGVLTIRALRETVACGAQPRDYTQGYLDTIGLASFTYGRFEVRAKSPTRPDASRGLWPAFWLRPDDGGRGEIDVVELPGGPQYHHAATQAIFYDYTPVKQDNRYPLPAGHPADGFHVYTLDWEPGSLRWYVDGRQVYHRDRSTTSWFDEAFSRPFNLRLNLQVGGWLGDPDAATVFPADFQVDYVRVWQR